MASELTTLLSGLNLEELAPAAGAADGGVEEAKRLGEKLQSLLKALPEDFEDASGATTEILSSLSTGPLPDLVRQGLKCCDDAVKASAAELVAKIAKSEQCRCLPAVVSLVAELIAVQGSNENIATVIQVTRALGNICCEHDAGRLAVMESGGVAAVTAVLQRAIAWPIIRHPPGGAEQVALADKDAGTPVVASEADKKDAAPASDVPLDVIDSIGNCGEVHELRLVVTGFFLNLTNSFDNVTSAVCTPEVIRLLTRYLDEHCDEEDLPTHVLLALNCMADSAPGRQVLESVNLSPQLHQLLRHNITPDVIEACLELATALAERDSCKLQLAVGGVCGAAMEVVERCLQHYTPPLPDLLGEKGGRILPGGPSTSSEAAASSSGAAVLVPEGGEASTSTAVENKTEGACAVLPDDEDDDLDDEELDDDELDDDDFPDDPMADYSWQAIIQTATDLIVLILLGDESMEVLYSHAQGPVFLHLVRWLQSDFEQLHVPAALAMGNFARTDVQSMELMRVGVSCWLLRLLQRHCGPDGRIVVQHSVLAALRNLSLARPNKRILIHQGALQVLLPLAVSSQSYPVVFKLLAVLRMLVDGNPDVAIAVGTCVPVVQKVLQWCTEDHPGVKAEASRLLASTIKNALAGPPQPMVVPQPVPAAASGGTGPASTTSDSGIDSNESSSSSSNSSSSGDDKNSNNNSSSSNDEGVVVASPEKSDSNNTTVVTDGVSDGASTAAAASTSPLSTATNNNSPDSPSSCCPTTIGIPISIAVLHSLVESGCLQPMLAMLQSDYPLMILEASLAVSLCCSVCKNLPGMVDQIDATALAKGLDNTALRTAVSPPPIGGAEAETTAAGAPGGSVMSGVEGSAVEGTVDATAADAAANGGSGASQDASAPDACVVPDCGVSLAMCNMLAACLAIADAEGGIAVLRAAEAIKHFTPLQQSQHPHIKMAADSICSKVGGT